MSRRSWFAVEGSLDPIGYEGLPFFRQLGAALDEFFPLRQELVRVNTGDLPAGADYDHPHILSVLQRPARPDMNPRRPPGRHSCISRAAGANSIIGR